MRNKLLLTGIFLLLHLIAYTQDNKISGIIQDAKDNSPLFGVNIVLLQLPDSSVKGGSVADYDGKFKIANVPSGKYALKISFIGYKEIRTAVTITGQDINIGLLKMNSEAFNLKTVEVDAKQVRVEQNGDTTQFHANAYKTHPDATTEDLVTKMPGVTSDGGTVKVNGEQIQKVLVDGKPFFGDDPNVALKNLPAEVVDKVQIYDKLSDQAAFTGIDDGNSQKTMNITTKKEKRQGKFGKVYAGYGTDQRYIGGGVLNYFNGNQRISILGLSNNINQQNFAQEDILGALGQSGGGGNRLPAGVQFTSRGGGGGGAGSNFLVGQQSGIATTNSIGLNFSDVWFSKVAFTASYFYNNSNTLNTTSLTRNYITAQNSGILYNENDSSKVLNYNHRINARLEYTIDSNNSVFFTPKLSLQNNNTYSPVTGINTRGEESLSSTNVSANNNSIGYNYSGNLTLRHKFNKKGRTISLSASNSLNNKTGNSIQKSMNDYFHYSYDSTTKTYQKIDSANKLNQSVPNSLTSGYSYSGSLNYTEPLSDKSILMFNYSPSYSYNTTRRNTYDNNLITNVYSILDTPLSNQYTNTYVTQRGGINYGIGDKILTFNMGADVQYATLKGDETFPIAGIVNHNFFSILPQANLNYKFSKSKNLHIFYRASTNAPSISQLQNVINNSNPLQLSTGNPDLKQQYAHSLNIRYGSVNATTAGSFNLFLSGNYTLNYIGNKTLLGPRDTTIGNETIALKPGSQLVLPINLSQPSWAIRSFMTYGLPMTFIKSNLNLTGGYNFTQTPAMINNQINLSNNSGVTVGTVLSSNVSQNLDFTLSYYGNYNDIINTLQKQSDNTYYSHTATLKLNWIFLKGFVFNTSIAESYYQGLSQVFNQKFLLWNGSFGYKFFENRSLEVKISAFDVLKQNKSISTNNSETYTEVDRTLVIQQYFMLNITYTLRAFKMPPPTQQPQNPDGMRPWGGEHRRDRE